MARSSAARDATDVEDGWEDRWREFHRPVRVGRSGSGRRGRRRRRRARGRHRPGPRLRHRRPPDDAALSRAAARARAAARCSTSAAARACSRSPPRGSASRRCSASTSRSRDRGDARERRGERRRGRRAAGRRATSRFPPRATRGREHLARLGARRCRRRLDVRALVTSGYLASEQPRAAGLPPRRTRALDGWARGSLRTTLNAYDPAVATFRVDFLGCKVSHVDAHEIRERLLARRPRRARRSGGRRRGDQHLLRHERGASRRAARPPPARRARTAAST